MTVIVNLDNVVYVKQELDDVVKNTPLDSCVLNCGISGNIGGWVDRFFHDLIIDYNGVVYLHV